MLRIQLAFAGLIFQFKESDRNQRLAGVHTTHLGYKIAGRNAIAQATG